MSKREEQIKKEILECISGGIKDKQIIYDRVANKLGVPRPSIRRVAKSLKGELANTLLILNQDVRRHYIKGEEVARY